MAEPDEYPAIADLAAIGDGHSLALLGPDARVEWFCPTRFDADPAVWPLLDRTRGGHLHIAPVDCVCKRWATCGERPCFDMSGQAASAGHA